MADPDEVPGLVVAPNSFSDGSDGITVVTGYNGEPRIKCLSGGQYQNPLPTDWIVIANGYSIVGPPTAGNPEGVETIIPAGSGWPPSAWPPQPPAPGVFQTGIPNVVPDWANSVPGPGTTSLPPGDDSGCAPPPDMPGSHSPSSTTVTRTHTSTRSRTRNHR